MRTVLCTVLCALWCAGTLALPVAPSSIRTVHVVQSCHLDLGFADFSSNIINRFFWQHFPLAIQTADALRQRGGQERLVFAVRPMLLSLYFDCPTRFPHLDPASFPSAAPFATMSRPQPLRCPNATEIATVRAAVARGDIVFDAFPVSAEPELYSAPVFSAGLELVANLADALNVSRPTTMSQRDVPGMSRAVVPLLQRAGVRAISVGANGGSAAPELPGYGDSRSARLSTPFVWRDSASGTSVVAHWHPGGYGRLHPESGEGILSSCVSTAALPGQAMCLNFRGDNAGPPGVDEVLDDWKLLRSAFPNATTVRAARFDEYFGQLDQPTVRSRLPVVTSEIGDSWLYGCGSDPLKLGALQVLQRHHDRCVLSSNCTLHEPGFGEFQRLLLLVGKHTWGGHTIIEDDGSPDTSHYTSAELAQVRWSSKAFITQQISWDEMRLQLWAVRQALGSTSGLGGAIDAELGLLTGPAAAQPLGSGAGWRDVPRQDWAKPFVLGEFTVGLNPQSGAIVSLQRRGVAHNWASVEQPLARFAYATHDDRQAEAFWTNYSYGCPHCGWAKEAFTKPGVTAAIANASVTHGTITQMRWRAAADNSVGAVSYRLELPDLLIKHYGAPSTVFVEISTSDKVHELELLVRWLNKTTTRLPESIWMEFDPAGTSGTPSLSKMGTKIDISDGTVNGSSLHAVDQRGVLFTTPGTETTLRVLGLYSPLVAVNEQAAELNLWRFPITGQSSRSRGIAFNLMNNLWNTNYIYWYPWRNATATEDDAAMTFKWVLSLA